MKSPVLLAVSGGAVEFEPVFTGARERAVRIGWLEFEDGSVGPPSLSNAPLTESFRAVAVGASATVAVKPRRGPAVLRDLIREHFLGADVVLVKGLDLLPRLSREGDGWKIVESESQARRLSLDELFARLQKPELRWRESEAKRG